jgi:hypothetical protein
MTHRFALCVLLLSIVNAPLAFADGEIRGWGNNVVVGQSDLEGLVTVVAGGYHSLGIRRTGLSLHGERTYTVSATFLPRMQSSWP